MTTSDSPARLRALTELDSTVLVEAAAGTGKTSLLAGRVIMLLAAGISPTSIAAITFTELAAGELRQRVARYLDLLLAGTVPDELRLCLPNGPAKAQKAALHAASERLDELTCSTIHGFCHDLLRTYSVEAGIDPGAEILDGEQADFVFDATFDQWWRDRLDTTEVRRRSRGVGRAPGSDGRRRALARVRPIPSTLPEGAASPLPTSIPKPTWISWKASANSGAGAIASARLPRPVRTSSLSRAWRRISKDASILCLSFEQLWELAHPAHAAHHAQGLLGPA